MRTSIRGHSACLISTTPRGRLLQSLLPGTRPAPSWLGLEPSQMSNIKRLRAQEPGVSVNADQLIKFLPWPL